MKVIISTPGVFHHFALARELASRNILSRIYTAYPWFRVKRERIPKAQVDTFPYFHLALLMVSDRMTRWPVLLDTLHLQAASLFDRHVANALRLSQVDYLIAASGSGFHAGRRAQRSGVTYVCDRGSSHMRYQAEIMNKEYARWGVPPDRERAAAIHNEEREYEQADLIFVPSEFAYRSFVQMGVPKEKLRKAVLAADTSYFYPVAEPASNEFCVLYVGQVSFRKGIPYLLEAFKRLEHPGKRLRLIGSVEPRIRKYLQTAPLEHVSFEGNQSREAVRLAMSKAHVTVLASVEDGFGMVMAEAMACGCPVISTEHTGGLDLYEEGKEGFIVPPQNVSALWSAMNALADASLRQRMAENALKRMQHLSGWHAYGDVVEAHLRAYKDLLAGRKP